MQKFGGEGACPQAENSRQAGVGRAIDCLEFISKPSKPRLDLDQGIQNRVDGCGACLVVLGKPTGLGKAAACAVDYDCWSSNTMGGCRLNDAAHRLVSSLRTAIMSIVSTPTPSTSRPNFDPIFASAFRTYKKKTGKDITSHPLAAELETCHSPDAILTVLRTKLPVLDQSESSDKRFDKWLIPTINVLYSFSSALGKGLGHGFPPAKAIFIIQAAKDVNSSREALIELFNRIEFFFRRLEIYTEVPPTAAMTEILVQIMAEVLVIVGMATKDKSI
ncbi:hypothetical protein BC827DRAFT_1159170 [Russula dissimulans]|nr:hypothetical protein BC827DRAFT_1159170 [Russula dissimulans]